MKHRIAILLATALGSQQHMEIVALPAFMDVPFDREGLVAPQGKNRPSGLRREHTYGVRIRK